MRRKNKTKIREENLLYKVEQTILPVNNSVYFLIQNRKDHSIPFTATNYLTEYTTKDNSPNTIRNIAFALAYLYSFATQIKLDLNRLIYEGATLTLQQIEQLRQFILTGGNPKISLFNNQSIQSRMVLTNSQMDLIKGYLIAGLIEYGNGGDLEQKIKNITSKFKRLRFKEERNERIRVLDLTTKKLLEEAFKDQFNPVWKDELISLRNSCIYGIADETGARIGEILGLYVNDLSTGALPTIYIVRRKNNQNDPRRNKPQAKTFSRPIPISRELHQKIISYIKRRPNTNIRRNKHSLHLFVSHRTKTIGKPLSIRQAHKLMEDVNRYYSQEPLWKEKANWHDVRHTALYRFYWAYEGEPNQKELLQQIGGHMSDTVFARYHQLAIAEKAQKIHRQILDSAENSSTIQKTGPSLNWENESTLED